MIATCFQCSLFVKEVDEEVESIRDEDEDPSKDENDEFKQ